MKKALAEGYRNNIHFIEYKELVNDPRGTMKKVYEFLGEPYYHHDFKNLKNIHQEDDARIYGFNDMHAVRPLVNSTAESPEDVLPMSIIEASRGTEFWREFVDIPLTEETDTVESDVNSTINKQRFFGEVIEDLNDSRFI